MGNKYQNEIMSSSIEQNDKGGIDIKKVENKVFQVEIFQVIVA